MQVVLKYLLILRSLLIIAQLMALAVLDAGFHFEVPWRAVSITLLLMTALTALTWRHLNEARLARAWIFVAQLLADIIALTVLVFFTGGALNPFISLFLLPITFAAAALPLMHTTIIAGAAGLAYTALMFVHPHEHHSAVSVWGFDLHVWGMWYGFLLSAACIAIFVARIARTLHEQSVALTATREHVLRNERIVALGTLAAGTAHELGTPLATMAIVAHDLASDLSDQPDLQAAVRLLQDQLQRCKRTLAQLAVDAGQLPAEEVYRITLERFLRQLSTDFRALNPQVNLQEKVRPGPPLPIVVDRTLRQALNNILNNAGQVSPHAVTLECAWDSRYLALEIMDEGPGIASDVQAQLGRAVVSSKVDAGGMGLGIYLATTTLQRYGGEVQFYARTQGGTRVSVKLPLETLQGLRG